MKIALTLTFLIYIHICASTALDDFDTKSFRDSTLNPSTDNVLKLIKIDNNKGTIHLQDHQKKVLLTQHNFDFSHTHPKGHDLYFKDSQHNILPHWIESYDPILQHSLFWVKVPSILPQTASYILLYQGDVNSAR